MLVLEQEIPTVTLERHHEDLASAQELKRDDLDGRVFRHCPLR
jgi:hypothetical protein